MMYVRRIFLVVGLVSGLIFGCAVPKHTADEAIKAQKERAMSQKLGVRFESMVDKVNSKTLSNYLETVFTRLQESSPSVIPIDNSLLLRIEILKRIPQNKWSNFAFPNRGFYLSLGLLKTFEYESEIAAVLAIQMAHLNQRDLLEKVSLVSQPGPDVGFFGSKGVFAFSQENEVSAIKSAVGILYRAGYDSRGVISVCERYKENLKKSPYSNEALDVFIETARREIALYSPVRNPIVRTSEFIKMNRLLRNL